MLLIYLSSTSSRTQYILDTIFYHEYGINYIVTSDVNKFLDHKEEKINYSKKQFANEFFIEASVLLFENFIEKKNIPFSKKDGKVVLFPNDKYCNVGFDVFAAVFFMLSCYEEYLPFAPDQYGRFKATDSLAYKNNFLQTPVVDYWLITLKKILQKRFPSLVFKQTSFKAIVTYDVDVAYKFKGRDFIRNAGATIKDFTKFDFKNIVNRYKTLFNKIKDPWDTYDYLKEIIIQKNLSSIFFFLMADRSVNDRNLSYKNSIMYDLVNKVKAFSDIGVHPSFQSSLLLKKIDEEKKRLENISGKMITKSRQHFLKFTLPKTYNALIAAGIREDYSMGFPHEPGFRAGTSKPFFFYDLKNEKSTSLQIFPITFMDATFIYYLKHEPQQCLEIINKMMHQVKDVGGTFISLWHNNTLSEDVTFKKWKLIHDEMIKRLNHLF